MKVWSPGESRLSRLASALMELGYKPHLPLASREEQGRQEEKRNSMKRLGVLYPPCGADFFAVCG